MAIKDEKRREQGGRFNRESRSQVLWYSNPPEPPSGATHSQETHWSTDLLSNTIPFVAK